MFMPAGRVAPVARTFQPRRETTGKVATWQTGMFAQARKRAASVADLGIQVRYASLDAIRPTCFLLAPLPQSAVSSALSLHRHLIPTTIESGPARCSTLVSRKPASRIHFEQSSPV
jgi:hypothetical protein